MLTAASNLYRRFRSFPGWLVALSLFAGLLCARPLPAIGRQYEVRQIAPHTFVWVSDDVMDQNGDPYFNRSGNAGFIITPDGVVVLDATNNPFHAREVLYEIRQRTSSPVRLVIDMGPEGDQMLGNEVFAEQHATIISSSEAESRMRAYEQNLAKRQTFDSELPVHMRGVHFTLPGETFRGERSFNVGGQEIRLISLNCGLPGAEDGDAVVYLPNDKVLFLGDLYVNGYVPQMDSRDIRRWIGVLAQMEKWNVSTYIPGHGNPGTKKDLANFRGFLEWLNAGVEGGVRQGKSLSDIENQLLSSSPFNLLALDLAPRAIAAVYHQLVKPQTSRTTPPVAAPVAPLQKTPRSPDPSEGFLGGRSSPRPY
ncbi:MAG TPA: MBL fold metallo-hydrolase [Terriglobia bacterium]|nr:MBL fold metallo-hydrolase [Terriglobia bacterium]